MELSKMTKLPGRYSWYQLFIRPILFRFDAESVHHFTLDICRIFWKLKTGRRITHRIFIGKSEKQIPTVVAHLRFKNPIGLAAGFDKNGALLQGIENIGFGFVEIGTVTPRPQIGNPRPRLSRDTRRRAILNQMGFNNDGVEVVLSNLKNYKKFITIPVGVNLGKNRDTPNSNAIKDYESLIAALKEYADYFTINVSSPNTPNLRDLQSLDFLNDLGEKLRQHKLFQPVFLKLAPDLEENTLRDICSLCGEGKPYSGLILTNTIPTDIGGISGYPLKTASITTLKTARRYLNSSAPIISVGGIETADDVRQRLAEGANAVQIYTSLIYQGPYVVSRILKNLSST